jgi:mannose-6-phosphate isomerase-like protein (cupin superfamily)
MPLESRLLHHADLRPRKNAFIDTRSRGSEDKESFTLIGRGASRNPNQHVHIPEPHGFKLRALKMASDAAVPAHVRHAEEVIFVQEGMLEITAPDSSVVMGAGDIFTTPKGLARAFRATSSDGCIASVVRGGDSVGKAHFVNAKAA